LTNEEYVKKDDPSFGQPSNQALAAKETLALYYWWKEERPKRYEASCTMEQEQEQEDEDTDMLIRLVKLRRYLWT
jgi:hypothetical protein